MMGQCPHCGEAVGWLEIEFDKYDHAYIDGKWSSPTSGWTAVNRTNSRYLNLAAWFEVEMCIGCGEAVTG